MYQTHGKIDFNELAIFDNGMRPMCGFRDGDVYCGTWLGEWEKVEAAWAYDTWGKWKGAPPSLVQTNELQVLNADIVREGVDDVYYVDGDFELYWKYRSASNWQVGDGSGVVDGQNCTVTISNSHGDVVKTYESPSVPLKVEGLSSGSYCVFARYSNIKEGLLLPPDYIRSPRYDYLAEDGRMSHYNPVKQVGEVPQDPNHELNLLRQELISNNEQEDVFEYSAFLTAEGGTNGDGSAIKVQIGGGTWQVDSNAFVTPSRPICKISTAIEPIRIDPMAHVISVALHTTDGKILLGGARFSGSGPRPSLWEWDNESVTLLGTTNQACNPYCEQMLSTGLVTDLVQLKDKSIIMLTLCSRHRYDPNVEDENFRLPRYPAAVDGEPGGQSMVGLGPQEGTRVFHVTESIGKDPDPNTPSFYNVGVDIQGDTLFYAPGTLANLDGCLWRHKGKAYGVRCDGPPQDDNTKCQITYYDGIWDKEAPEWKTKWAAMQRGMSLNGNNIAFGFVPGSESAVAIWDNGRDAVVKECDYRVRRATITSNADSAYYRSAIMTGHKVIEADGNKPQRLSNEWYVIETDGLDSEIPPPIIYDPLDPIIDINDPCIADPNNPGHVLCIDPNDNRFVPYPGDNNYIYDPECPDYIYDPENPCFPINVNDSRRMRIIRLTDIDTIYSVQLRDTMSLPLFKDMNADLNNSRTGVRLRVDSDADPNDVESFVWRVQLDQLINLPIEAYKNVEMLVVTDSQYAPEQLPIIARA